MIDPIYKKKRLEELGYSGDTHDILDDGRIVPLGTQMPQPVIEPDDRELEALGTGAKKAIGATIGGVTGAAAGVALAPPTMGLSLLLPLALSFAGAYAGGKVQEKAEPIIRGEDEVATQKRIEYENQLSEENPKSAFIGEALPSLAAFRPSITSIRNAGRGLANLGRQSNIQLPMAQKVALANTGINAGLGAGTSVVGDLMAGEDISAGRALAHAGVSALMSEPTRVGRALGFHATPPDTKVTPITGIRKAIPPQRQLTDGGPAGVIRQMPLVADSSRPNLKDTLNPDRNTEVIQSETPITIGQARRDSKPPVIGEMDLTLENLERQLAGSPAAPANLKDSITGGDKNTEVIHYQPKEETHEQRVTRVLAAKKAAEAKADMELAAKRAKEGVMPVNRSEGDLMAREAISPFATKVYNNEGVRQAGSANPANRSIKVDVDNKRKDTIYHEVGHVRFRELLADKKHSQFAKNMLKKFGWDGVSDDTTPNFRKAEEALIQSTGETYYTRVKEFGVAGALKNFYKDFVGGVRNDGERMLSAKLQHDAPHAERVKLSGKDITLNQPALADNDLQELPPERLRYEGYQPGFGKMKGFKMFTIMGGDINENLVDGSTISERTLARNGLKPAGHGKALPDRTKVTVQDEVDLGPKDGKMPGYKQVDFVDEAGNNTRSSNIEQLRREGYNVPDAVEKLPQGQHDYDKLKAQKPDEFYQPVERVKKTVEITDEDRVDPKKFGSKVLEIYKRTLADRTIYKEVLATKHLASGKGGDYHPGLDRARAYDDATGIPLALHESVHRITGTLRKEVEHLLSLNNKDWDPADLMVIGMKLKEVSPKLYSHHLETGVRIANNIRDGKIHPNDMQQFRYMMDEVLSQYSDRRHTAQEAVFKQYITKAFGEDFAKFFGPSKLDLKQEFDTLSAEINNYPNLRLTKPDAFYFNREATADNNWSSEEKVLPQDTSKLAHYGITGEKYDKLMRYHELLKKPSLVENLSETVENEKYWPKYRNKNKMILAPMMASYKHAIKVQQDIGDELSAFERKHGINQGKDLDNPEGLWHSDPEISKQYDELNEKYDRQRKMVNAVGQQVRKLEDAGGEFYQPKDENRNKRINIASSKFVDRHLEPIKDSLADMEYQIKNNLKNPNIDITDNGLYNAAYHSNGQMEDIQERITSYVADAILAHRGYDYHDPKKYPSQMVQMETYKQAEKAVWETGSNGFEILQVLAENIPIIRRNQALFKQINNPDLEFNQPIKTGTPEIDDLSLGSRADTDLPILKRIINRLNPFNITKSELTKVHEVSPEAAEALQGQRRDFQQLEGKYRGIVEAWDGLNTAERDVLYKTLVAENANEVSYRDKLPEHLHSTYDDIRKTLEAIVDEQNARGELVKDYVKQSDGTFKIVMRERQKNPFYFPNVVNGDVIEALANPRGALYSKLREDLINHYIKHYGAEKGKEFGEGAFKDFVAEDGRGGDTVKFSGNRKAEGIGLPASWIETDPLNAMRRYLRRSSNDMAFFTNIENKPTIARMMGIERNQLGDPNPTHDADGNLISPLHNNENVRNILDIITGKSFSKTPALDAAIGIANSMLLGPVSGLVDVISVPFNIAKLAPNALSIPETVVKGFMNYKKGLEHSYETGFNKKDPTLIRELFIPTSKLARKLEDIRSIVYKVQGRRHLEIFSRALTQSMLEHVIEQHVVRAKAGEKNSITFLKKMLGSNTDISKVNVKEAASNAGELVQGTYDFRQLPIWAMDSSVSPIFRLARWNIEQTNNWKKYVWDPAVKDKNFVPLLLSTLGAVVGGAVVKQIRETANDKKAYTPTLEEITKSSRGVSGNLPSIAYQLMALSSYTGYMGIVSDFARSGLDVMVNKNHAQSTEFPFWGMVSDTTDKVLKGVSAVANGEGELVETALNVSKDIATGNLQLARLANTWILANGGLSKEAGEKKDRNEKFRDRRAFAQVEGLPVGELNAGQNNPYVNKDVKRFKQTDSLKEASQALPGIIRRKAQEAQGNPERLKQSLTSIRSNRYDTVPNPKTNPREFSAYIRFIKETQGEEAAQKLLQDYYKQNNINQVKKDMLPRVTSIR